MEDNKTTLIKKIVTFEDMSQSQIDRMNLNNSSYSTVIKFLDLIVEKIEKGLGLEEDLEKNLKKMIAPSDPEDDEEEEKLSPNQQINLYLGLLKHKSELSAPIITVLKEAVKVNVVNNTNGDGQNNGNLFPTNNAGEIYTKEQIQQSKKLLRIGEIIESSECSLDEIEALIQEKKKNK